MKKQNVFTWLFTSWWYYLLVLIVSSYGLLKGIAPSNLLYRVAGSVVGYLISVAVPILIFRFLLWLSSYIRKKRETTTPSS